MEKWFVMKRIVIYITCLVFALIFLTACVSGELTPDAPPALPAPEIDGESMFGIDKNININTIDDYLGRDDVEYIDVRMLFDPADFEAIGGEADLTRTIRGFKVVPYPFIATLPSLPVSGAYDGSFLYTLLWNENGELISASPNFVESEIIVSELFPKDKAIFLMCGGGGYSGVMKSLLIFLGWNEDLLYNIGANWTYNGENSLELIIYPEDAKDNKIYATWRADYAYIEFSKLQKIAD